MKQIDNDAKQEIDQIESKNQSSLSQVKDMGLRSKAEKQLVEAKLKKVAKEIEVVENQIKYKESQNQLSAEANNELKEQNKKLGSEIVKKDRDIAQNEKKILYLKKKTQELEKFKFVLDFKIKELRRDIAPREQEIHNLRIKTKEMDKELKKYNTINASLGFMVDDLRTRQETMQEVIKQNREIIRNNNSEINGFKNAVHSVIPHIDTQESLQKAVWAHLGKYIQDQ